MVETYLERETFLGFFFSRRIPHGKLPLILNGKLPLIPNGKLSRIPNGRLPLIPNGKLLTRILNGKLSITQR